MPDADKPGADQELGSQMLEAALRTAVGAIVIIDERGLIRSVNPATQTLFGYAEGRADRPEREPADAGALPQPA